VDLAETDVLAVDGRLSQGVAFGGGRFDVTDIFYVTVRGRSVDVVSLLLDHAMSPRYSMNCRDGDSKYCLVINIVIVI
jgi:hypothetical protein